MTITTPGASSEVQQDPGTVSVTIDGTTVSVPKGTLVIRAAEQVGIEIPRFCDHPLDRKSTRLNSSHVSESRMPSSA